MTKVTIKDIARMANVSTASVSMVLNNKPCRISTNTKEKIIKIAKELDYIPNHSSELFQTSVTKNIGVIIPDMNNNFFQLLSTGIEKYAYQMGYGTLIGCADNKSDKCLSYITFLLSKAVDGIILVPTIDIDQNGNNLKLLEMFSETKIPKVLLDRAAKDVFCDFVTLDNYYGGLLATEYLIKHGHKKIGCITGPLTSYCARKRFEGFREALINNGLSNMADCFFEGDFDLISGFSGIQYLLKRNVTAVFASNDVMAFGIYQYAKDKGLRIPHDLSIIGFDDLQFGNILSPPLTSVNQPAEWMGRRACELLIERIGGINKTGPKDYLYTPTITERGSVRMLFD